MRPGRAPAGAVVANPGQLRWLGPLASALEGAGLLSRYCTSVAATARLERAVACLPSAAASAVNRELRLRPLPEGVPDERVRQVGTLGQLAVVALTRRVTAVRPVELAVVVNGAWFDRATARQLRSGQRAVVAETGAAMKTFERAHRLSIPCVLDYPTTHHRFTEDMLREEAEREPEFAETLQLSDLPPAVHERRDREIELADRIFVLSRFSLQTFLAAGVDPAKLVHTPLGIDLEAFRPAPASEGSSPGERRPFRVLFAGQITQRKGISYLLDAFAQADLPDAELVFLGRPVGPTRSWIGRPGVRHWPAVPFGQLRDLYLACDVFVLPSLAEGFPQTAAIAMACGLPVIVSDHTFGGDVVDDGDSGYVVGIRDAEAIAARLRRLWVDPAERLRMGAAARRRAETFTWERYGARVVAAVGAL